MEKRIQIDSVDGYLHIEDLPHNCIFNKVVTGCGGTTVALRNDEDYIIAVPTTELIINKIGRPEAGVGEVRFNDGSSRPVYGLHGKYYSFMERDIMNYVASNGTRKIICTYDKIPKLCEIINPKKYRLLVDEYHRLLKDYSYRERAIDGVLVNFRRFKSFCFMSATPIQPLFKPSCLEDVDDVIAEWQHQGEKLRVKLMQTNKPYTMAANIINKYLTNGYVTVNGIKSYEAFFFINSVTDIAAILEHCHLNNDDVRIICAKNEENERKLNGYVISSSLSDSKRFNFITSKSFEGADYFSDNGICYVVSSASNKHTLASIDTDIPQIAGRIRTKENPFRYTLIHIFNTNHRKMNLDVTFEEMKAITEQSLSVAKATVKHFNDAPADVKDHLRDSIKHDLNRLYMSYDKQHDVFILNDRLPKLELYNYMVNQEIYKNGLNVAQAYNENGFETTQYKYQRVSEDIEFSAKKQTFKELFIMYADLMTNHPYSPEIMSMEKNEPLLREAYMKLGTEKVKALRYTKKSIKDALISQDKDLETEQKIAKIMVENILIGEPITVARANQIIADAYSSVGIKHTAKAKDLHKWFECSDPISKRIDGKVIKCVDIYRTNFIFKDETNNKLQNI